MVGQQTARLRPLLGVFWETDRAQVVDCRYPQPSTRFSLLEKHCECVQDIRGRETEEKDALIYQKTLFWFILRNWSGSLM